MRAERGEVDADARREVIAAEQVRQLVLARRPQAGDDLSCVAPAGSCALTDAVEDEVDRLAQDLGADDGEA